jgi:hypothetical protein
MDIIGNLLWYILGRYKLYFRRWDNALGIASGYELELKSQWGEEISFLYFFQTSSGVHQPPIKWVLRATSLGVKWQGREANHSPPTSVEVKKTWVYTSISLYVFIVHTYLWS